MKGLSILEGTSRNEGHQLKDRNPDDFEGVIYLKATSLPDMLDEIRASADDTQKKSLNS
jgi:hypothetical protein